MLEETAIDPIVENASDNLGYRAGLTADTLARTELESNTGGDQVPEGSTLSVSDLRASRARLRAANVRPREGMDYVGIFHPYAIYDIVSDNSAGGYIDIKKYANPQDLINGECGKAEGVRILESTNVATSGTAPNVLYASYIVGRGAMGGVALAGRGPSRVRNPETQSFRVNVIPGRPQIADPEGKIGAAVSYRFVTVYVLLDETTLRYETINADASLV